jgi:O-acetyl-ADP-ribose deacetylase (regulator of RNase III)
MTPAVTVAPEYLIAGKTVRLTREDITLLEVDGFVYYAQPDLVLGSGFGGAIGMRGGASIQKELNQIVENGPLSTTEVVVTEAGKLPANLIFHAVGPRFREDGIEEKLRETVDNVLRLAEEREIEKLAFPAMGVGFYGIPAPVSARVMLESLKKHLDGDSGLEEVTICVLDTPQFNAFQSAIAALG